ncbi:MAG TPA: prepilin-type N-terminal cleavage/methylation domain-containing protein [Candidatus Acidoferrales bacterium]|nr:prepilin-type N-terminal cleavage/methylation domain-containing protein [Candidatus Acidoferrales bacterium]
MRVRPGAARGFSLVELLLVLVLLGAGMFIVLPAIDRRLSESEVKKTALGLAATARSLRARALYDGYPQYLTIDAAARSYETRDGKIYLAPEIHFAEISGGEPGDRQERTFVFFPNGSVSGGVVAVQGDLTGTTYSVHLESLTGRVFIQQG